MTNYQTLIVTLFVVCAIFLLGIQLWSMKVSRDEECKLNALIDSIDDIVLDCLAGADAENRRNRNTDDRDIIQCKERIALLVYKMRNLEEELDILKSASINDRKDRVIFGPYRKGKGTVCRHHSH